MGTFLSAGWKTALQMDNGGVLYQSDYFGTIEKMQVTIVSLYTGCESSKAVFDGKT